MAENLGNDFATTLNGAINDSTTSITVTSGTGAPSANFRIRIDDELMLVTSTGAGTNWTVTRAVEGSVAAAHSDLADVSHVVTTTGLENWGWENFAAPFPGAESGKSRLVRDAHKFNVLEELLIEGDLIVEGEVRVLPLP